MKMKKIKNRIFDFRGLNKSILDLFRPSSEYFERAIYVRYLDEAARCGFNRSILIAIVGYHAVVNAGG